MKYLQYFFLFKNPDFQFIYQNDFKGDQQQETQHITRNKIYVCRREEVISDNYDGNRQVGGQLKPQKTSFSTISKISAGSNQLIFLRCSDHSLFQNNNGEIFACGNNTDRNGECGSF